MRFASTIEAMLAVGAWRGSMSTSICRKDAAQVSDHTRIGCYAETRGHLIRQYPRNHTFVDFPRIHSIVVLESIPRSRQSAVDSAQMFSLAKLIYDSTVLAAQDIERMGSI